MESKYSKKVLAIIVCVAVLLFPLSQAFSKSSPKACHHRKQSTLSKASKKISHHRKQSRKKLAVHQKKRSVVRSNKNDSYLILGSAAVFVEDQQTGECLIQKKAGAVVPIASITKLMTAMVVLDAKLDLEESLRIEEQDIDTLLHSRSRIPVGTYLTRREALLLALMSSDNRCAHALGRTYPGGLTACVTAMNRKARSLGLFNTRFQDTSGLSSGNVSSASDLARLVDNAYRYGLICEFTTCKKAVVHTGWRTLEFHNTNHLVKNSQWEIGLSKTGYTDDAGRCLVMQANVAERPLLIVLLDSQGKFTRIGDANRIKRWLESRTHSQQSRG